MSVTKCTAWVLFGFGVTGLASAGVVITAGNNPQTDSSVSFNCPTVCTSGPATTVVGHLQQVTPDTAVDFISDDTLTTTGSPGNGAVSGMSSTVGIDDVSITVPGHTFTSLILQASLLASAPDGYIFFTVDTLSDGSFSPSGFADSHTGGGQNYFTITTTLGSLITDVHFSSWQDLAQTTTNYQDNISQVRIGGVSGVTITPEPATDGLAGLALAVLSLIRRRKRRA